MIKIIFSIITDIYIDKIDTGKWEEWVGLHGGYAKHIISVLLTDGVPVD